MDETPNAMSQPNQPPTDNQLPVNQSSSLLDNQLDANQHPSDNDLEASQSKVAGILTYIYTYVVCTYVCTYINACNTSNVDSKYARYLLIQLKC